MNFKRKFLYLVEVIIFANRIYVICNYLIMKRGNPILDLSFKFALNIIEFSEILEGNRKFILSKQLLRSGTSIGANIREAQSSESKPDFIHKMKIASKEANETEYWLMLCNHSQNYPSNFELVDKVKEIQKILTSIIYTSKNSMK